MARVSRLLMLCACIGMLGLPSCAPPEQSGVEITVLVHWNARDDLRRNQPGLRATVGGEKRATGTFEGRVIGDLPYNGLQVYLTSEMYDEKGQLNPRSLLMEVYVRRSELDPPAIDIRLSCKQQCALEFDDFEGGVLQNVATQELVEKPYTFEAGDYHLRATKPEGSG